MAAYHELTVDQYVETAEVAIYDASPAFESGGLTISEVELDGNRAFLVESALESRYVLIYP